MTLTAKGPDGLKEVLENILAEPNKKHDIRYEIGSQISDIEVDMSVSPIIFQYSDTKGRPATPNIKKIIADFLWEKCGDNKKYKTREEFDVQFEKNQFIDIGRDHLIKETDGGKNFGINQISSFRLFGSSNPKTTHAISKNNTDSITPSNKK